MKTRIKVVVMAIAMTFGLRTLHAQAPSKILPLEVGDTLPAVTLGNVVNGNGNTINTADLRGKAILIDFWATWCGACIATIPKLNDMQARYKGQLQVILVNSQDRKTVEEFYKQRKDLAKLNMFVPSLAGDTLLHRFFPHTMIPHTVLINPQGKVTAITHASELTDANIIDLIASKPLDVAKKTDRTASTVDENNPFFAEALSKAVYVNEGKVEGIKFRSSITPYVKGIRDGHNRWAFGRSFSNSYLISSLYGVAYEFEYNDNGSSEGGFKPNKIIYDVKADDPIRRPVDKKNAEEFAQKNLYSYDVVFPEYYKGIDSKYMSGPDYLRLRKLANNVMKKDLDSFFRYKASVERRKMRILTLRLLDSTKVISPLSVEKTQVIPGGLGISLKNERFVTFKRMLWHELQKYYITDLTNYTGNVNFDIKVKLTDIETLAKELAKYGLQLKEEEMATNVLVIRNSSPL